jgi:hypothetical protein
VNTKMKVLILSALLAVTWVPIVGASTVVVGADTNSPVDGIFTLTSFAATGFSMALNGLTVTINFSSGPSQTIAWTHPNSGACLDIAGCGLASGTLSGGVWTLTETGDTGGVVGTTPVNAWTLTNTSTATAITSVVLNGGPNVVFDRDRQTGTGTDSGSLQEGTPGSAGGITYKFGGAEAQGNVTSNVFTANVTYSGIANVNGIPTQSCLGSTFNTAGHDTSTGCGDIWNNVTFTLTGGTGGFIASASGPAFWTFFQDTDLVGAPEPATLGFVGLALAGLFGYRIRRSSVR